MPIPSPQAAARLVRGPILNPQPGGTVAYWPDGALVADAKGALIWAGPWDDMPTAFAALPTERAQGVLSPPFLDAHTHIPQFPIKGRFTEGVGGDPPEGRLLAGLNRNVFPEEGRNDDPEYTAKVVAAFQRETLRHGVVGGAAYMTVHPQAARTALANLPDLWHVGLVLMDQNCPTYLRTDTETLENDLTALAAGFGRRVIVTDRFAVACSTPLRHRASVLADVLGLRTQTHLNEQRAEKAFVEQVLYPASDGYRSYTDVYRRDGLLDRPGAIMAHCLQMRPEEWHILANTGAAVAHCPTSNTLLGSGVLLLDQVPASVPYALCTDVGASPTCSLLQEMAEFLKVHHDRSRRATPEEALFRATLAPAQILGLDDRLGTFAPGMPLSYVDLALPPNLPAPLSSSSAALRAVLGLHDGDAPETTADARAKLAADSLAFGPELAALTDDVNREAAKQDNKVLRVVLDGETVYLPLTPVPSPAAGEGMGVRAAAREK